MSCPHQSIHVPACTRHHWADANQTFVPESSAVTSHPCCQSPRLDFIQSFNYATVIASGIDSNPPPHRPRNSQPSRHLSVHATSRPARQIISLMVSTSGSYWRLMCHTLAFPEQNHTFRIMIVSMKHARTRPIEME